MGQTGVLDLLEQTHLREGQFWIQNHLMAYGSREHKWLKVNKSKFEKHWQKITKNLTTQVRENFVNISIGIFIKPQIWFSLEAFIKSIKSIFKRNLKNSLQHGGGKDMHIYICIYS